MYSAAIALLSIHATEIVLTCNERNIILILTKIRTIFLLLEEKCKDFNYNSPKLKITQKSIRSKMYK